MNVYAIQADGNQGGGMAVVVAESEGEAKAIARENEESIWDVRYDKTVVIELLLCVCDGPARVLTHFQTGEYRCGRRVEMSKIHTVSEKDSVASLDAAIEVLQKWKRSQDVQIVDVDIRVGIDERIPIDSFKRFERNGTYTLTVKINGGAR